MIENKLARKIPTYPQGIEITARIVKSDYVVPAFNHILTQI